MTEAEIQHDVQRFTGEFVARVNQSAEGMFETTSAAGREQLMRLLLMYYAATIDIATGPVPEVNLLDMLVFTAMVPGVFEQHWLPRVFGEAGRPLARALRTSERQLWETAGKVLNGSQQEELRDLIHTWLREHPEQTRVEAVRLGDFSEQAGQAARSKTATGLLASVKSATRSADEAVLLGERALFLAQRAPFLLRIQTRLGVQEILSDSEARLHAFEPALASASSLRPIVRELSELATQARETAEETRRLTEAVTPLVSGIGPLLARRVQDERETTGLEESLGKAQGLTESALALVRELRAATRPGIQEPLEHVTREADRLVRRWLTYALVAGVLWAALFWAGYYAVSRAKPRGMI